MRAAHETRLAEFRDLPVAEAALRLGVEHDRRGLPCPSCHADRRSRSDRRRPVGVTPTGTGWHCFPCGVSGDALDYASWHVLGRRLRDAQGDEVERVLGRLDTRAVPSPAPRVAGDRGPLRPPAAEVSAFWSGGRRVHQLGGEDDRLVELFLHNRGFGDLLPLLALDDLARVTNRSAATTLRWWPASWRRSWRLVVRAFEADGRLASVHARAVDAATPKTRWPSGSAAGRLLFACPVAQKLMVGNGRGIRTIWICEGLTDWLSLAAIVARDGGTDRGTHAVLGATSGGFEGLGDVRWPDPRPDVLLCVDADPAGDRYAEIIGRALGGPVRRVDVAQALGGASAPPEPPGRVDLNDALIRGVALADLLRAAGPAQGDTVWEPPVPLRPSDCPEPFPVSALPEPLARFVMAVAEETQTPPDLAGLGILGALAVVCGGRLSARAGGHWEPTNLFLYVAMPPASRKSRVAALVTAPLYRIERRLAEEAEPKRREAAERVSVAQARLEAARKRAATEKADADIPLLAALAKAAAEPIPTSPRLLFDDTTVERLASVLAENEGRAAIVSADAGVWDTLLGRYANGVGSIEVFLKGHAGDPIVVDRVGRGHESTMRPALTVLSFGQPSRLWEAGAARHLRGRGLLPRFLYSLPRNTVGWREADPPAVSDDLQHDYDSLLSSLYAELTPELVVLPDAAAYRRFIAYKAALEPRLRPSGDLAPIGEWAGKLAGAVLRIATLLHAARGVAEGRGIGGTLGLGSVEAAIRLGDYLVEQAFVAFQHMRADAATELADHILSWIRKYGHRSFRARDAFDAARKRSGRMPETELGLKLLVDHGYIRAVVEPRGVGRPRTTLYEVHPSVGGGE